MVVSRASVFAMRAEPRGGLGRRRSASAGRAAGSRSGLGADGKRVSRRVSVWEVGGRYGGSVMERKTEEGERRDAVLVILAATGGGGGGEVGGDGQGLQPVEGVPQGCGFAVGEPLAALTQLLGKCVAEQALGGRGKEEAGERDRRWRRWRCRRRDPW